MPALLTTAARVMCNHGGTVTLTAAHRTLSVDGAPVLVKADLVGATVTGCATPQSNSTKPCLTVTSVLAGESRSLTVAGAAAMSAAAQGLTDGVTAAGPGQWSVSSTQSKLVAS